MAFTAADIAAIESAMVTAAVDGIASVTVDGNTVTNRSLDELRRLLEMVTAQVAGTSTTGGMRIRTLVPPECG
jgi:hypothetical protein